MAQLFVVVLYLMAAAILLPLIWVLGVWLKGASSIVLPGLGLVVATPLLLMLLVAMEVSVVFVAAYCIRYMPLMRMMFDHESWPR